LSRDQFNWWSRRTLFIW